MARNQSQRHGRRPQNGQHEGRSAPARDAEGREGGNHWIWGTHAVSAVLANPGRRIDQLLLTEAAKERVSSRRLPAQMVTVKDLDLRLPPGAVHQGAAVKVQPLEPAVLEDVIASGASRLAVLDQLSDPHNLGAIFRSAAAFGFEGVVLQTRVAPPISGIVAKSAAGAIESVQEVRVVNISRALEQLAEAGFHTVGLAGEAKRSLPDAVHGAGKIAIVLGAEGEGLRPGVAKACAELARIPISPAMESLNVSNAAAIAFYEAARG
jgi:23S rRNA (guanosine2251-2'-O)-methyltransferase